MKQITDSINLYSLNSPEIVKIRKDKDGNPLRVSKQGTNNPLFCTSGDGNIYVFKPVVDKPEYSQLGYKEAIYEICASYIMRHFSVPTITYKLAIGEIDGNVQNGIISEYVEHVSLEEDPDILEKIKNSDEALRGMIFDAWLGNFDRILTNSNIWVMGDGRVIFGDYHCAFRKGLMTFGLPKVNLVFMNFYGKKEIIEKAIEEIVSLSDKDIICLVEDSLMNLSLDIQLKDYIIHVLIANRDEIKLYNPFRAFYDNKSFVIEINEGDGKDIAEILLKRYGHEKKAPSYIAEKAIEKLWFYNVKDFKPLVDLIFNAINEILLNNISGRKKSVFITIDNPELFKLLNNPSIMLSLKTWLRNGIKDIVAKLFSILFFIIISDIGENIFITI